MACSTSTFLDVPAYCTGVPRILMPSIVNTAGEYNGASTVTRGLVGALAERPIAAQVQLVPVRNKTTRWRHIRQLRSLLGAAVSTLPSKALFMHSRRFLREVKERVRNDVFQLVILNGNDLLWLMDYLPNSIPRLLVAHNIEHKLFESQIHALRWKPRPLQALLEWDCRRLHDLELGGFRRATNVLFLSRDDATYAARSHAGLNALTVPPLFEYTLPERPSRIRGRILELGYVGNFAWWPNQAGLRWFLQKVFPSTNGAIRLHLFGQHSKGIAPNHPCILKHGIVDPISEVWRRCDILICPEFSGGGVSVKFAEAIYNRMPVLATGYAARGLALDDDPAIMLLDRARDWVEFLNSSAATRLVSRRPSTKAAATFSIETHKDALHRFVQGVLSPCRA